MSVHAILRILSLVIPLVLGSWLIFDGSRAFVVGDYITPSSGPYAGQLGPWSRIVSAVGLEPRSVLVKSLHIGLGVVWLAALALGICQEVPGRWTLGFAACCTLWYLPVGTVLSVVELVLLGVISTRAKG